ncbi:MAG TPA: prolyl oligopeptidase family serine peptidase [Gemmatimonadales bacterium]|nr:prolyl oligopeptidase family serine peptidase [Gemmatimonadales bacterium]
MSRVTYLAIAMVFSPYPATAQGFPLTVETIMRGPELVGTAPSNVQFGADGRYAYFHWRQPGVDTLDQDYRIAVAGPPQLERLPRGAVDTIPLADGAWSPDRRREVVTLKGDLWVVERTGAKRRLTQTPGAESAPSWSADGRTIYFTRDNNVWALDLAGGRLAQLTDIRRGPAPSRAAGPVGQKAFLRDQQRELFDFIRRQVAEERLRADTDTVSTMKPLYLAERQSATRLQVAPDGRFVLATITERSRGDTVEGRQVQMPLWVTQSGYVETQQIRTKVGDAQARQKTALIEVATGRVTWIDTTGLGTREADVSGVGMASNARHALIRIATTDYNDAWLVVVDLPSLERRVVAHLHDDAWLDGPLAFTGGWIPGSETVYYGSEETGYAHLYAVPAAGGPARALTGGKWEVQEAEPSPDGRSFYLHTNEGDFGQVHFSLLDVASGRRTQVTTSEGRQDVVVSPDGRTLAVLHSTANHPAELYFQPAQAGAAMRKVTESTSPAFRSYDWIKPEIVMIPAADGVPVPARLYRPRGGPSNRAAVIFVHGAGYLQNVHKWWSSYYREYMFHHLLAAHGYTVLDLDYRGSAGQGRDWRTAIYRYMGGKDLDDQVSGARWLVQQLGIDSTRIGIYGGSYGGFITLMAMFTRPGVFAAGAALRPVTDWAHYNHPYTARILNEPQADTVAYRRSSPIYFAEGLRGRLLICHGMVDDNVHFEDTARLVQRLIELGKDGWEVAVYPVEPHGFRRNDSWTDEYRRILRLFDATLPAGPGASSGRP